MARPATFQATRRGARREWVSRVFAVLAFACTLAGVLALALLLYQVLRDGAARFVADVSFDAGWPPVSADFLTTPPSRFPEKAGLKPGIAGSLWVMGVTALMTIPIGMGAAIWLELYAPRNILTRFVQLNIANLAGVPSIIYGILGLALFVRQAELGRSVLAAAMTMGLLVLPIVIIASQEALRAVPTSLRDGALALGATRWQTVRGQILPVAIPGMLTGVILALSRAIGETAPLIMVGAFQYVAFTPGGVTDLRSCGSVPPLGEWAADCPLGSAFTVMPVQIYDWARRPQEAFQETAAAGIIVLLIVLLSLNSIAIVLRNRYQRKVKW